MTIVRVGKTDKYASGWDSAFGGKKPAKSEATAAKATAKKAAPKKAAAKKPAKKGKNKK